MYMGTQSQVGRYQDKLVLSSLILTIIMLLSPFSVLNNDAEREPKEIGEIEQYNRLFSQNTVQSLEDFEVGGYHLGTGEWWEPKVDYVPSSDDPDADGINSSIDSFPWNPHQPLDNQQDCELNCESRSVFSIAENGELLPYSESFITYSEIVDGAIGDLDRDGDLDLAMVAGDYLELSENIDGEFQSPNDKNRWMYTRASGFNIGIPSLVHFTDMDADGDLDIIVGGSIGIGIVEMNGFEIINTVELVNSSNNDAAYYWEHIAIGDVNDDGLPDIAVASSDFTYLIKERIVLFTNQNDGSGISMTETWSTRASMVSGLELADIDDDGFDDLVYAAIREENQMIYNPEIFIHVSDVNGPSSDPSEDWSFHSGYIGYIWGIDIADLNNDGFLDIFVSGSYTTFIMFNDGSSGLDVFPESFSTSDAHIQTICDQSHHICQEIVPFDSIVDINNDGLNDILWGNRILLNEGTNDFGVTTSFKELKELEGDKLLVGDLTGNNVKDIISVTLNGPIAIFNHGGAILDSAIGSSLISPAINQQFNSAGAVADLNTDGHVDIITTSTHHRIGIHLNDGAGIFTPMAQYFLDTMYFANSVAVEDIDQDGLMDIVVASAYGLEIFWQNSTSFFNNTNRKVIEYTPSEVPMYSSILIEDFDNDGAPEIAFEVTDNPDTNVGNVARIIEYSSSSDSFSVAWTSAQADQFDANSIKLIDLDNDGNEELVRCMLSKMEIYNTSGSYFDSTPWTINSTITGQWLGAQGCVFFDGTIDGTLDLLSIKGNVISMYLGPNFEHVVLKKSVYAATSFDLNDMDQDGFPELIVGTSSNKKMRIHNINTTGIVGLIWEAGDYKDNQDFRIADFDGDGSSDILQMNYGSPWDIIFSVQDTDYDTIPDRDDQYVFDPTQTTDSDDDGFGDNQLGRYSDFCPYYWGDSVEDRRGCPDQDGDGWSDLGDDFWREPTQWKDTDGDGFGDNHDDTEERPAHWPGEYVPNAATPDLSPLDFDNDGWEDPGISEFGWDDCPKQEGWSFEDRIGCIDTDYDGWSNNDDDWDQGDVFENDITQWADSDGDGFGDNLNGTNGDEFPNDPCAADDTDMDGLPDAIRPNCATSLVVDDDIDGDGFNNSMEILLGTNPKSSESKPVDYDGDGIADVIDAFPEDPEEFRDKDKDGIGDNSDFCLNKETNESVNCVEDGDNDGFNDLIDLFPDDQNEWVDTDGDGVGDNSDVWANDPEIWSDSDEDGWADQFGHLRTDDCPSLKGTSNIFMNGCSDLDEDGMPDILDPDIDGDGITNDNEMDASTTTVSYDPFDAESYPPDIDGDFIPDVLDHDRDGDGFPDEFEKERGSDYKDPEKTPFNQYGNQDTGLFYVPGEGFKSQYDPEGVEISVSWLIDLITSELLVPIAMIPLTVFALLRKRRRYKKLRNRIEECKDLDMLKEYEEEIDDYVINRKVKVEHGMLLRNMFERMKEEFEDQEQVRLLGGKSASGSGGMGGGDRQQGGPMRPGSRGNQGYGGSSRDSRGPSRPGGRY